MPFKSKFESFDRPGFIKEYPTVVQRGETGYWQNFSTAGFIIARCNEVDLGGPVFATKEPELTELGSALISWSQEDFAGFVPPGLELKVPITEEDNEEGLLIIKHEMPGGEIISLN